MEILLLSDTANPCKPLQQKISEIVIKKRGKIAYISSTPQGDDRYWFHLAQQEYKSIDQSIELEYFDLSDAFGDEKLKEVLRFGTIHLSGGNTFEFLNFINRRSFGETLKNHLQNGGLIIGVSAGAIVLTPNIGLAELPGADENLVGLKDMSGLGFVNFEFHPHFKSSDSEILQEYLKSTSSDIYISTDEDGVLVTSKEIHCFGKAVKIQSQSKIF